MRGLVSLGAVALVFAQASSLAAPAAAASPELKCQDTVAVQARNYFKSRFTAVAKCEQAKAAGKLSQATNCRPDVGPVDDMKAADKLAKSADKLGVKVAAKCNGVVTNIAFGVPCGTVASVAELNACLTDEAHGHNADLLAESVFDSGAALTFACVGGSNAGGTCDPKGDLATECPGGGTQCRDLKSLRLCQKTIATAARNYAKDRMTARRSCAKKLSDGKLDATCPDAAARAKLAKSLDKFRGRVLKKCTDSEADDALLDLGFPCDSFRVVTFERDGMTNDNLLPARERLARCVAAAAAGDGDLGADTAYPLPDAAPFSYGVAAGDATDSAIVFWTRTDGPGTVTLEVATDDAFANVVHTDAALTPDAAADNTVKTDVAGLSADTQYFYRFTQGGSSSRVGRVRTAPAPATNKEFKFVWTGDSNAYFKPYTVLDFIPDDDPDVWLYIGDTIYGDDPRSGTGVAVVRGDYHTKYKENRSDNSLRNVMGSLGTYSMWDDHEVTNDFWGTDPSIATQMAAGNQAYRDYLPVREDGGDPMRLYRSFQWGALAEFFLIDARQYRDAQAYVTEPACLSAGQPVTLPGGACTAELNNPARTYLGAAQKAWLKAALLASTAKFKFVMNGPLLSALIFLPYDRWEGYNAERLEMLEFIEANNIKNVVFLSTDIHALIVNGEVTNPGASGGGTPEWVAGAIGMDPIFRELPGTIAPLVPTLPTIFPTITNFDIDRFNYGVVEVGAGAATLSYRDNTGAVIASVTLPEEP